MAGRACVTEKLKFGFRGGLFGYFLPKQKVTAKEFCIGRKMVCKSIVYTLKGTKTPSL